jgi:uncharacterized YigZ family protein
MFTIEKNSEIEIIEKKSKFITRLLKTDSEEEIKKNLKRIILKEKGAVHNCYAFRIIVNNAIVERKNDDGEPGGTAGAPMLSVLSGEGLVNILAVTTRYFGGIKLGTGGLVSVYKHGVQEAVKSTRKIIFEIEEKFDLVLRINQADNAEYRLKKENIKIIKKIFSDDVVFKLLVPESRLAELEKIALNLQAKIIKE